MTKYDIAIIGGGPGGYVAAIRGAQRGASVVLIEEDAIGGTCLNRGCIPTKALYATSRLLEKMRDSKEHGIVPGEISFDFIAAAMRKDSVVKKLVSGVVQLLKGNGVTVLKGRGELEGPERVLVRSEDGDIRLSATDIIVATGGAPLAIQALPFDRKNILTSGDFLDIKELPETLLIVGGGYIGCEFASIFATLGCNVTLVEQLPRILFRSDRQAAREVEKGLKEKGVALRTSVEIIGSQITDDGVAVALADGTNVQAQKVLVAVGRSPRAEGLGLETVGLADSGPIAVDNGMRTNAKGIYAIGDVTGGIQLAHVASYQADVAISNIFGENVSADYRVVPSCIFTYPEVAQVGMTEDECRDKGVNVDVGRFAYLASGKALCEGETAGSVKVIAEKGSRRLVGVTVVGEEASTLISEVAVALKQGMTVQELAEVIHAHPTLPEIIKEAAEDVEGLAVHKIGRRRVVR